MTSKNLSDDPEPSRYGWLIWPLALIGGVTAAALTARRYVRRSLPRTTGDLTLPGLRQPVEIVRDQWGIPHIYAVTEDDLFFAQGYTMAQDRLFQMDLYRRLGMGRTAEIVGPRGLPYDRFAHAFGWPRAAAASLRNTDDDALAAMTAYSAGVNTFMRTNPLPPEFSALAYRPDPWAAIDTAAWGIVLAWGLSVNWETEMLRAWLINELGVEKTADLTLTFDDDYPTTVPDTAVGNAVASALSDAYRTTMDHLPLGVPLIGQGLGSNNWVVSGKLTDSGRPHVVNDPHLPPIFPTIWYGCHLSAGRYHVAGFALPGVPGVVIGHNDHVAWGLTNGFPDIQDVFIERLDPEDETRYEFEGQWRPLEITQETIKVRGGDDETQTIRATHHGPLISDALDNCAAHLALNWSNFHSQNSVSSVLAINRAANVAQFRDGLRHWAFPGQNIVYADTHGDIGYMMPGLVPRRRQGHGLTPVPGWTGEYEWDGWIPFEKLPHVTNPPEGFIATANNQATGDNYPEFLGGDWLADYRVRRIRNLLTAKQPLSLADHQTIQNDTVSLLAQRLLKNALPALAQTSGALPERDWAVKQLQAWNGDMRPDSVAATLYFGLLVHFTREAVAQAIGRDNMEHLLAKGGDVGFPLMPFYEIAYELAARWLEGDRPDWVGDVAPLLGPSLDLTLADLRELLGDDPAAWSWGNVHQIAFDHQLASLPGIGRYWKPERVAAGGDGTTVNQNDVSPHFPPDPVTVVPSCRIIMDVGAWDNCLAALPGGQAGHPSSDHYQDLVESWQQGRMFPLLFSRDRVDAMAEGTLTMQPAVYGGLPENGR